jgi:hypothetical protein
VNLLGEDGLAVGTYTSQCFTFFDTGRHASELQRVQSEGVTAETSLGVQLQRPRRRDLSDEVW